MPGKAIPLLDLPPAYVRPEDDSRLEQLYGASYIHCHMCGHIFHEKRPQCSACGAKPKPPKPPPPQGCELCRRRVKQDSSQCPTCGGLVHRNCLPMHRAIAHGATL
jgi:RNA polymerase subunit RPABC4/transcription elongation factor Spt4